MLQHQDVSNKDMITTYEISDPSVDPLVTIRKKIVLNDEFGVQGDLYNLHYVFQDKFIVEVRQATQWRMSVYEGIGAAVDGVVTARDPLMLIGLSIYHAYIAPVPQTVLAWLYRPTTGTMSRLNYLTLQVDIKRTYTFAGSLAQQSTTLGVHKSLQVLGLSPETLIGAVMDSFFVARPHDTDRDIWFKNLNPGAVGWDVSAICQVPNEDTFFAV